MLTLCCTLSPWHPCYDRRWFVGKTWYNLSKKKKKYRSISDGSIRNFCSPSLMDPHYGFALNSRYSRFVFFLRKSRVAKPVDTYKIASIFDARLFYNVVRTHTHTHVRPFSTLYARVMIERYVDSVWTVLLILRVHNTPSSPRRWNIKSTPLPRFVNIGEEKKLYTRMGENNLESVRSKNYTRVYIFEEPSVLLLIETEKNRGREEE